MTSIPINIRRPQISLGNKSGAVTIDASDAELQQFTATGNITLTVTGSGTVGLVVSQDATGGRTVTYGPDTLAIDTDPGASTLVEIWPGGEVVYPEGIGSGGLTTEGVQDVVGAMIVGAGGTYDDASGTITLPAGGSGGDIASETIGSMEASTGTPPTTPPNDGKVHLWFNLGAE